MSNVIHVLFADDMPENIDVNIESQVDGIVRAINPRLTARVDIVTNLNRAVELLSDLDQPIDLAFLDVHWKVTRREAMADALLRPALARRTTATVLISADRERSLLEYLYSPAKSEVRPHAVMYTGTIGDAAHAAGVVKSAFSAAQLPLQSRLMNYSWKPSASAFLDDELTLLVLQELAAMHFPDAQNLSLSPITGGLSGSSTLAVRAESIRRGRTQHAGAVIKLDRDIRGIKRELNNHASYRAELPPGTFAPLANGEILSFAGFHSIAIELASARTAESLGIAALIPGTWNRIFGQELIACEAQAAASYTSSLVAHVASAGRQLGGNRWARVLAELPRLGLEAGEVELLSQGPDRVFPADERALTTTIQHGDLHTRNVMVDSDRRVYWVDAASMAENELWCADLARFSTWLACELLGDCTDPHVALRSALDPSSDQPDPAGPDWINDLRSRLEESMARYVAAFAGFGHAIDPMQDWRAACCAELLRCCYSSDWFDRATRASAARLVSEWTV